MSDMKSPAKNIRPKSLDELFNIKSESAILTVDGNDEKSIQQIPLDELHTFKNHPFKVKDDADMAALVESIIEKGILTPLLVRPYPDGGYEVVSGHRRRHAAELAELETVPVIVKDLSDDDAAIYMVDTNLQREHILPSERAWAYKIKLDAMSHQGKRTDLTCAQIAHMSGGRKSRDILAEQVGESKDQVRRYIRLTYLFSPLLDMVDAEQLKLIPAVELSYISTEYQQTLYAFMQKHKIKKISLEQAKLIRSNGNNLSEEDLKDIFDIGTNTKGNAKTDTITLKIPTEYFPQQDRKKPPEALLKKIAETIQQFYTTED